MYGRRQAVYYGELLRTLRIPISYPVISSPFCRAIETAQLAFGWDNISVDPFLFDVYRLSGDVSAFEHYRILDDLTSELEKVPPPGSNTVIIAHSFPSGIGLGQISDMGTVIIKPYGRENGYKIISKLTLEDLEALSDITPCGIETIIPAINSSSDGFRFSLYEKKAW